MSEDLPREVWRAPAKINLCLSVLGRRADGYHAIDTVLQTIDLHDTVTLRRGSAPGVSIRVVGPAAGGVPEDEANLAVRAARELAERTGRALELGIELEKRVPAGAGLGGGSSDAAAVLLALAHRFAVPDPVHTVADLAAGLGADVPFFLRGGTWRGVGKGERLVATDPPAERWGVLVVPRERVSTATAYAWWDEASGAPPAPGEPGNPRERLDWQVAGNDLEEVVALRHPVVARVIEAVAAGPAVVARMTGTGSGVFGLYDASGVRDDDVDRLREAVGGSGVRIEPFVCVERGVERIEAAEPVRAST